MPLEPRPKRGAFETVQSTVFEPNELALLRTTVGLLSQKDLNPPSSLVNVAGPEYGVSNTKAKNAARKLRALQRTGEPIDFSQDELYVLHSAVVETRATAITEHVIHGRNGAMELAPLLRLGGKLALLRGFDFPENHRSAATPNDPAKVL